MEPPLPKRCRPNERYCVHCKQIVSYKTFKAHKRLYNYNCDTDSWAIRSDLVHHSDEDEASCLSNLPILQSQPLGRTEEYEIENDIPPAPSEDFTCDDNFSVENAPCSTPAFSDLDNDDCEVCRQ